MIRTTGSKVGTGSILPRLLQRELGVGSVPGVSADLDVGQGVLEMLPDLVGLVRSGLQVWQLVLDMERKEADHDTGFSKVQSNLLAFFL